MKFEDIVKLLGDFGSYQKKLYFLLCIPTISIGMQTIMTVFSLGVPHHRCSLPDWDNDTYAIQGDQHARAVNAAFPLPIKGTQFDFTCLINDNTNGTDSETLYSNTTRKCDNWVYDNEQFGSTIVTKFGWVCDLKLAKFHVQMVFMLGFLLGSLLLVAPADNIGRKKMFMVSVVFHIVSTISIAFVSNFATLGLLYCIIGMSCIGIWSNSFVVGVELVGPSNRVWTGIIVETFWTGGALIVTTIAYFVRNWQHVQLIGSVPTVLFLSYYWLMPESARWLISKQKYDEADQILRHAAKVNKATLPSDMFSEDMQEQKTEEPLRQMFKRPALVIRSFVLFLNWFVASIGFYGLGLNVANLGGSVYTNLFIAALTELAGHASCLVLLNRVGRKSFHCFVMILGGLCCTATILPELYGNGSLKWLTIALALTGQGFVVASFDIIWLYSSELFPTVIRSSALAVANIFARVGGIISPYIAGLALVISGDFGRIVPLIIIGTSMIVAGVAALVLPETVNNPLPDNIDDAWRMQRRRHSDHTGADFIDSHGDESVILRPVETHERATSNNGVSTSANRTLELL